MDYERNKKYFSGNALLEFAKSHIIITVVVCFLLAFTGVGMIACVLIGVECYLMSRNTPKDEEIDAAVSKQMANLKDRALRKLGIDEDEVSEIAPITFDGYVYDKAMIKKGKDGLYRSNKYQAVMFFFSQNEVHCYTYDFCITENRQRESTDVYFYKDIVSVSTQTDGTEYSVGGGKNSQFDYEYFKLTTTGGTSVSCSVRNIDDAQRSINGMRSLIKIKKMA